MAAYFTNGNNKLYSEDVPQVKLNNNQVRVKVAASGVNFADVIVKQGLYSAVKKYGGYPVIPGFDFAGTVSEIGRSVTTLKVGDKVFGVTRFGGYSSEIVADANYIFKIPTNLSFAEASSLPTVFLTAHYALQLANISSGDTVLIHSAAGGVGLSAVQLAKYKGAEVVALVGSESKVEIAKKYGADHVFISSKGYVDELRKLAPQGFRVILDPNGVKTLKHSFHLLAPNGDLVIYGFASMLSYGTKTNWFKLAFDYLRTIRFSPFDLVAQGKRVSGFNLIHMFDGGVGYREAIPEILKLLERGNIKLLPIQTFAFSDYDKAHALLESGQSVGKIILEHK